MSSAAADPALPDSQTQSLSETVANSPDLSMGEVHAGGPQAVCASVPAGSLAGAAALSGFADGLSLLTAMAERAALESGIDFSLIVRGDERPGIAAVGRFDPVGHARIEQLISQVVDQVVWWNHIDFETAVAECEVLGSGLVARLGSATVAHARFVPVPRGGLIVLGILAMVMGLRHDQFEGADTETELVVIVDDCAFTGHRLRQLITSLKSDRLACALLRAPVELCRAIEEADPRVCASVVAEPLPLIANTSELSSEDLATTGERYWVGRVAPVTFAWKEPDRFFWNAASRQYELGWHVMPRQLCLGGGVELGQGRVLVQPTAVGPFRPHEELYWMESNGTVTVVSSNESQVIGFDLVASAIWIELVRGSGVEAAIARCRESFEVPEERIRADVEDFVGHLLAEGLLRRT